MRWRRTRGEYRALLHDYVRTYLEAPTARAVVIAVAAGSAMAVLGAAGVFGVTRTIYRVMSPIGVVSDSSLDGFWLAPLIVLWPLAPAAAAVISRRTHRLRWASWSVLPSLAAFPLGSYLSSGAYALAAAIAVPAANRRTLGARLAAVGVVGVIGAAAVAVDRAGVSIALAVGAFVLLGVVDRAARTEGRVVPLAVAAPVAVFVALGLGVDAVGDRLTVVPAPGSAAFVRPELQVCTGEVSDRCARDAVARAGFAVALIPEGGDADPYEMYVMQRRDHPVESVVVELAGQHGELISLTSRPTWTPRGTVVRRTVAGTDIAIWIEDDGSGDGFEATWARQGESYGLAYSGHALVNRSTTELSDIAVELISRVKYVGGPTKTSR